MKDNFKNTKPKYKPLKINVTKFFDKGKNLTLKQIISLQNRVVSNLTRQGSNYEEINNFVKLSNKLKRTAGRKMTKRGKEILREVFNYGNVKFDTSNNKFTLEIDKLAITKYNRLYKPSIGAVGLNKLSRKKVLTVSDKRLIKRRWNNILMYKDEYLVEKVVEELNNDEEWKDIINNFYDISKYLPIIKRILRDNFGINDDWLIDEIVKHL